MNSHVGSWSPKRTPEFLKRDFRGQNSSPRNVLYIIGKVFKSRCLYGPASPIWTFETQVMAKRKIKSQIGSLTLDHKKLVIDPIFLCAGNMQHTVGKLLTRATTLL